MTQHSRCSNIILKDAEQWFIWPMTGFSGCFPSTW